MAWKPSNADSLAADIHDYLREKEKELPIFHAQSPQLSMRRYLVDWVALVAEKHDLTLCSKHVAVSLLDFFMDQYTINEPQVKLVVLGCLIIACKLEEQEINIPKSSTLNLLFTSPGYSPRQFMDTELLLLKSFDWKVAHTTASHFIDYFLSAAVNSSDIHNGRPLGAKRSKAREFVVRYCIYFLEVSLQGLDYRKLAPSMIAAASVMSTRVCLDLQPRWTQKLCDVTRYSSAQLGDCVVEMLKAHQRDREENDRRSKDQTEMSADVSEDQGYASVLHTPASSPSSNAHSTADS